jgi:crotonobetainyl-CoA:carnitine CoA-transferase CaiB-like acyl-CoA transferase
MSDLQNDPHFIDRGIAVKLPHALSGEITVAANPIKCSQTRAEYRLGPPVIGQHTAEVLRDMLGLDENMIADLAAKGVI